ncbi:NACHT domain-containing protein [Acinetobacter cumulans]|uniref:NACHT domain-containing protein n=1 Tax=Acinetobacter cumulans TaxID=2136182 RepID=UPI000D124A3A|nr:NACHT domain-containing protein [Acinetobacter cumulans]QCO20102.1 NACHT domain-containing protein [Acinetobacter cumulans]
MVDPIVLAEPAINIFEKIFNPLKQFAEYQLDKVNFQSLSLEAHNKLADLAQVRTINEFDKSVSLYDFYVPPQVTDLESNNVFMVDELSDFASPKKVLISGIVGQGKSILMRNLAIQESFKGEKFPIFIELRDLQENENLEKFVHNNISYIIGLDNHKLYNYLLNNGKVILFFDGFDEVKTNEMGRIVKEFERLEKKFPKLDFIVSSRPEETIDKSTIFSKFMINKLTLEGQVKIIEKLTNEDFLKINLITNLKKSNKDIQGVLVTPLMVNFYFYLYKTEQITGTDITLFYNQLFDLTLRKHDGTKLIYNRDYVTGLKPNELQSVFECICFLSCKQKTFFFSEYNFRETVEKAIKFEKLKCSVNDLIRDLTTGICFICREGQTYAFLHTSIPEFFGAKFIVRNINLSGLMDEVINNYQDYINLVDYMEVIDEKLFLLNFLKPLLDDNIDYFKSKKVLDNIYISSKFYDKNKRSGNVVRVLTLFDTNIHTYIAFDFKEFIKPSMREDIKKRFKRGKKTNYQFFWTPRRKSSGNIDEIEQSENYFLHERLDNIPETTTATTRKEILNRIKNEEFKAITENYSQRSESIEKALKIYILRLEEWSNKIMKFQDINIDDLFS